MKKIDVSNFDFKFHMKEGFLHLSFNPKILSLSLLLEIVNKMISQNNKSDLNKITNEIENLIQSHSENYNDIKNIYGSDMKNIEMIKTKAIEVLNGNAESSNDSNKTKLQIEEDIELLKNQLNYLEEAVVINNENANIELNKYIDKLKNKIKILEYSMFTVKA